MTAKNDARYGFEKGQKNRLLLKSEYTLCCAKKTSFSEEREPKLC